MAVEPVDPEDAQALARLPGMVDGSLLPTAEVGSDLACLLASHGVWT